MMIGKVTGKGKRDRQEDRQRCLDQKSWEYKYREQVTFIRSEKWEHQNC